MTLNGTSKAPVSEPIAEQTLASQPAPKGNMWVIALITVFALAVYFLTTPDTASQSLSPVAGLMSLRAAAQTAIPFDVAVASQKPTLIEFYADWCTTCQAMAPTLQSLHHEFGDRVNFVMLNIDEPQWQGQVQQYRVTGVPHLTLLNADQTLADTFVGKVPQPVLTNRVAALLG